MILAQQNYTRGSQVSAPTHGCAEGSFYDLVTGEQKLQDATIRRSTGLHAIPAACGKAGLLWEPKP